MTLIRASVTTIVLFLVTVLSWSTEETLKDSSELAKQLERVEETVAVSFLVTGTAGTGKSTLINGLVGKEVAKVGDSQDPETQKVKGFPIKLHGVRIMLFDSPGLQYGLKSDMEYLKDIEETCKGVDRILYTIKMTATRFDESERGAMHKLTCAFGAQFWDRVIFVLTFANMVRDPEFAMHSSSSDLHLHENRFEKKLNLWKKKLPEFLKDMGSKPCLNGDVIKIPPATADRIPILPAAHTSMPHLPGHKFWISKTWETMFLQLDNEAKALMLKVNENRLKPVNVNRIRQNDVNEQSYKQADGDIAIKKGIGAAAGAAVGGAIGGPVGALVGAFIGAFIPNTLDDTHTQ